MSSTPLALILKSCLFPDTGIRDEFNVADVPVDASDVVNIRVRKVGSLVHLALELPFADTSTVPFSSNNKDVGEVLWADSTVVFRPWDLGLLAVDRKQRCFLCGANNRLDWYWLAPGRFSRLRTFILGFDDAGL